MSGAISSKLEGRPLYFGPPDDSAENNIDRMDGLIDEIRVYHKYLTKDELNELFDAYYWGG